MLPSVIICLLLVTSTQCLLEDHKSNETKNEIEYDFSKNNFSENVSFNEYDDIILNSTIPKYNISGVDDYLKIIDVSKLSKKFPNFAPLVGKSCRNDLAKYIKGLHEHKIWAVKSKSIIFFVINLYVYNY